MSTPPVKPRRRSLLRRLGFSRVAVDVWFRRAVFLLGGLCVGGAAVVMALMADKAQALFRTITKPSEAIALVVTPEGFPLAYEVMDGNTSYPASLNVVPTVSSGNWNYWLVQSVQGLPPIPHPMRKSSLRSPALSCSNRADAYS